MLACARIHGQATAEFVAGEINCVHRPRIPAGTILTMRERPTYFVQEKGWKKEGRGKERVEGETEREKL